MKAKLTTLAFVLGAAGLMASTAHAQDKVVDALHVERGSIGSLLESCRCDDPCDAISTCNAPSQR